MVTPSEWSSGRVKNAVKLMEMKAKVYVKIRKLTLEVKCALSQYRGMPFFMTWLVENETLYLIQKQSHSLQTKKFA